MNGSKIGLLVGATGLIGSELLHLLVESNQYRKIVVLARKQLDFTHPLLEVHLVDFDKLSQYGSYIKADDVFCCLGTTMRQAGSKENFYKVDFTYVAEVARIAARNGTKRFLLVSAMGADANSGIYYNRVKGEIENEVKKQPFEAVFIFQPSLLLGNRKESRIGEEFGKVFARLFAPLIPARYKAIEGRQVAAAMLKMAGSDQKGVQVLTSDVLQKM